MRRIQNEKKDIVSAALLSLVMLYLASLTCVADDSVHLNRMASFGIEANRDSISAYLDSLRLSEEAETKANSLLFRLGHDDYQTREQAAKGLLTCPRLPKSFIDQVADIDDLEVRWRAERILAQSARVQGELFRSVLTVVAEKKVLGLTQKIVAAMPLYPSKSFDNVIRRALAATFSEEEYATIRNALKHPESRVQIAAIYVVVERKSENAMSLIRPLLTDGSDLVKLFAAKSLANIGEHASMQPLVELLHSKELSIRSQAAGILRSLTRQRFNYVAYEEAKERSAAINAWSKWVSDSDESTQLFFPLKDAPAYTGKILVCNYSRNFIFVMDEDGKELWRKEGISEPFGLEVLANGNRLVAACTGKYVAEYDVEGKEIWKASNIVGNPLSVQRLSDGRTLVATGSAGKAIEFGQDGEIKAEITVGGFVADSVRLPNGRTLIARYRAGTVVEVDRNGKILWEIGGFKSTRGAKRLPNGNTLVTDYGNKRVVECDRDGKVVWEVGALTSPYDSWRLEDGRTLISESNGVRMVDQKGKLLWKHAISSSSRIYAF